VSRASYVVDNPQPLNPLLYSIFGGPLTIEQFRSNFKTLSNFVLSPFPMIAVSDSITWSGPAPHPAELVRPPAAPATRKKRKAAAVENDTVTEPTPVVGDTAHEDLSPPSAQIVQTTGKMVDWQLNRRILQAARRNEEKQDKENAGGPSELSRAFAKQVAELGSNAGPSSPFRTQAGPLPGKAKKAAPVQASLRAFLNAD
jgi:hypothetical protein